MRSGLLFFTIFISSLSFGRPDPSVCEIIIGEPLSNAYGPYDYTNMAQRDKLPIVLGAHFTSEVERLVAGNTSTDPYGDLNYTLRAIPNYHRALYAISRYDLRYPDRNKQLQRMGAECFFERAVYFSPQDYVAYMLYGLHLHRLKRYREALEFYKTALSLNDVSAELHNNIGLLYFNMGDIDNADVHARRSKELGYPLNGLSEKIKASREK
ncbi:tetratricopeptide repeat protein [Motiliproteus sediminis]|uniref:tetratricopeptide repeat protein n=1 Tax=Motiliproteus sediminis TaxID=1468178 RepID=UPI001AEF50A4|nr:tetratricopeptide repeat protein [Motiliproteus sediminis]